MKKALFEGEEILRIWEDCTLTNKRVWRQTESGGQSEYRGFPLNQLQGAMITKSTIPWLMYIGCAIWVLSLFSLMIASENKIGIFLAPFSVGCIFLAAWHFSKRAQVFFCSGEVKIRVHLHANDQDYAEAVKFISDVELAATSSRSKAASAA